MPIPAILTPGGGSLARRQGIAPAQGAGLLTEQPDKPQGILSRIMAANMEAGNPLLTFGLQMLQSQVPTQEPVSLGARLGQSLMKTQELLETKRKERLATKTAEEKLKLEQQKVKAQTTAAAAKATQYFPSPENPDMKYKGIFDEETGSIRRISPDEPVTSEKDREDLKIKQATLHVRAQEASARSAYQSARIQQTSAYQGAQLQLESQRLGLEAQRTAASVMEAQTRAAEPRNNIPMSMVGPTLSLKNLYETTHRLVEKFDPKAFGHLFAPHLKMSVAEMLPVVGESLGINPETVNYFKEFNRMTAEEIHDLYGGALTMTEVKRLQGWLSGPSSDPDIAKENLTRALGLLKSRYNTSLELLRAGNYSPAQLKVLLPSWERGEAQTAPEAGVTPGLRPPQGTEKSVDVTYDKSGKLIVKR